MSMALRTHLWLGVRITARRHASTNHALPGETVHLDYRVVPPPDSISQLRVATWNIERGYQLPKVIAELRQLDADLICLQEIDVGCERSGFKDVGLQIASELQMNYFFVCEFEELHSPLRKPQDQGGGIHGNAILSRLDFQTTCTIPHREQPVDWNTEGDAFKEPRRGARVTPAVTISTAAGPLRVYGPHLELFCGATARMRQMQEIIDDAECQLRSGKASHVLVGGDLNTGAHGFGRAMPRFARDHLRWRSIGYTEAEWWDKHFWNGPSNDQLGLFDPFDKRRDHSMIVYGPGSIPLWAAKLDWLLVSRGVNAAKLLIGGSQASDHLWLSMCIKFAS